MAEQEHDETEVETKTIVLRATWESRHEFVVPVDYDPGDLGDLSNLMEYIKLDPEGGGDFDSGTAELMDWTVRG
jgi:hypothetical protein